MYPPPVKLPFNLIFPWLVPDVCNEYVEWQETQVLSDGAPVYEADNPFDLLRILKTLVAPNKAMMILYLMNLTFDIVVKIKQRTD